MDPLAGRVMLRFQAVMAEFLESQQQILTAFLRTDAQPPVRSTPAAPGAPPPAAAAAVVREAPARPVAGPPPSPGSPAPEGVRRFTVQAADRPIDGPPAALADGHVVLVTEDGLGVTGWLRARLESEGRRVVVLRDPDRAAPDDEDDEFVVWCELADAAAIERAAGAVRERFGPVAALVHLAPVAPVAPLDELTADAWTRRLDRDVRSLFLLARALHADLTAAAARGGAAIVGVSALGGAFGSDRLSPGETFFPGHGGITGFLKTVAVEWPDVRTRAVDVDPSDAPATLAARLAAELRASDAAVEIGYRAGRRLTLNVVPVTLESRPAIALDDEAVLLVTGGARGITADICRDIAPRCRPTLILAGQTAAPPDEAADLAGAQTPTAIRAVLIARAKRAGTAVQPAAIERECQTVLREREIRDTLAELGAISRAVEYHAVDVRDADAFGALIDDVYARHGRIDGVVHGAGIIEDKLVADKTPASFDRVFRTKAVSAFVLARRLRPESLRFLVLFASVAGRFGNRGQSDYAAANEVMNKLAVHLDRRWPGRVVSINWGPWDKRGMVSPELKAEFRRRGIALVTVEAGRRAFHLEVVAGHKGEAEVVVGDGPLTRPAAAPMPYVARAARTDEAGVARFRLTVDLERDGYLADHRLDGAPVLPFAMATELMAECAAAAHPALQVVGLEDVRLLKGITVEQPVTLVASVHPAEPSAGGATCRVEVMAEGMKPPLRYRSIVRLATELPAAPVEVMPDIGAPFSRLESAAAYRDWSFHERAFQRLEGPVALHDLGVRAQSRSSSASTGMAGVERAGWLVDPFVFDVGLQLILFYSRGRNDMTALPSRFRAFRRYGPLSDAPLTCVVAVRRSESGGQLLVNDVYFLGPDGRPRGVLEGMEATCSQALNRVAGLAGVL